MLYDPWTISHLETTGVGPGWQWWEVGAGGGSIAAWLAQRCGPRGHVLVTDIDERYLVQSAALNQPMIGIQRHDIVTDPLPAQSFDLIHERLVLFHVPAHEQALERMVTALKPGGWLVIEAFDCGFNDFSYPSTNSEGAALYQKMQAALGHLMEAWGVDPVWGQSLYRRLQVLGLVEVGMEGYAAVREGRSAGARMARANFEQIRQEATAAGLISEEEVAQMFTLLDDPNFAYGSHIMFMAWGVGPTRSLSPVHVYCLPVSCVKNKCCSPVGTSGQHNPVH